MRRPPFRSPLLAAAVVACLAPASAQDAPPPAPAQAPANQPTFRGRVNFVPVDVIVTDDRGQPVADLVQADFELREDGRLQTIDQFRLIKADGSLPADDGRGVGAIRDQPTESSRVFAIFFDEYHVTQTNWLRVRDAVVRFVRGLGPDDLIALMRPLMSVRSLEFTREHDEVLAELQRLQGRKCETRPCDFTPRNQVEENWLKRPGVLGVVRPQVVLGALEGLAVGLGSLRDGRKTALYISEGFSAQRADLNFGVRDVVKAANRQNVAFYSLDPRGLTNQRTMNATDLLRTLAEETDGRFTVNRNAIDQGLAAMARDSSLYYLLGYNSDSANDGKFHEIRVRIKRRGVDVRARKGYWALTEEDAARAAAPPAVPVAPEIEAALGAIAPGTIAGRSGVTWLGTSRGDAGKTRLTIVWEPIAGADAARPSAQLSVTATDSAGATVFEGRAPAPESGPPRPQQLAFDAAPGALSVRVDLENDGVATDTEVRRLQVPDLAAGRPALGTPRVFRSRTAREMQALIADAQAVPTAARSFSRTERLLIRFDVYAGDAVRAGLINRQGGRIIELPVTSASAGGTHQIELGMNVVPPGEYLVEVAIGAGGTESREFVAFRVGA